MYLHKENRELFRDAILLTSQKLEVSEDIVEKDYFVTLILKTDFRKILILPLQNIWEKQEGRS